MNTKQQLKTLAQARRGVIVPGAFNALSARVVADRGFEAIYVTGAGVTKDEVRELLLDALADLAANLQKN